jgi:G:T-mismatch repair DNA endonuclease (very short patch repair protein)
LSGSDEASKRQSSGYVVKQDGKTRIAWWIKAGKPNPGKPFQKGHKPLHGGFPNPLKGRPRPRMLGNKYGRLLRGIPKSEEWKLKASIAKMGERNPMRNPVYAKRLADSKRGKPNPKQKEFWRLHKEEQLRKMMVGEHKKPNKLELRLIDLINRNGLQFRYVGNWELLLGGKCPDFVSTNDSKQLIELFGAYWHTVKARETTEERIAHFAQFGYKTLILWEGDLLDEDATLKKIRDFANGH